MTYDLCEVYVCNFSEKPTLIYFIGFWKYDCLCYWAKLYVKLRRPVDAYMSRNLHACGFISDVFFFTKLMEYAQSYTHKHMCIYNHNVAAEVEYL